MDMSCLLYCCWVGIILYRWNGPSITGAVEESANLLALIVRWWLCHAFANLIVVVFSIHDLIVVMKNPMIGAVEEYNMIPNYAIAAIHFYHLIAFSNLTMDDWIHHILFAGSICTLAITQHVGPIQNVDGFFLSGLPGGLDYCMMAAVKHGYMTSQTEKKWNARINVWIRAPGCVMTGCYLYVSVLAAPVSYTKYLVALFVGPLTAINGLYYMQVVVGNTCRKDREYSC
jgi:hypothetical protein